MFYKMSNYIIDNYLCKDETLTQEQREVIEFGIVRILEDIPKYLALFIIGLYFKLLPLLAIVLVVTMVYKTFVGGAHARTNLICFFSSTSIFLAPVIIAKYINFSNLAIGCLFLLALITSVYVIIKIAPADTEEVPILNKEKRKRMKIFAMIVFILLMTLSVYFLKNVIITKIILLTIISINLLATNTAYKIYKCKHSYESEEFKEYFTNN